MKKEIKILFLGRKMRASGRMVIYCHLTLAGRRSGDFSTGLKLDPDEWHAKAQRALVPPTGPRRPVLLAVNERLGQIWAELTGVYRGLTAGGRAATAGQVRAAYLAPCQTLLEVAGRYYRDQEVLVASGHLRPNTLKTYAAKNNLLKEYGRPAPLDGVNTAWFRDFEHWMLSTKRFGRDHAGRVLGYLRMLMRLAVGEGLIPASPVEHYHSRRGRPDLPVFLTEAELQALREYRSVSGPMLRTRDLFLFQCLTGLAYADLGHFRPEWLTEDNGLAWLRFQRHKSGEPCLVPLGAEARALLDRYGGRPPLTSLQIHNLRLKEIAAACGIPKRLTSHIGRKTFATLLLNKGVSLEAVAAMLGHSSTAMTQRHYARVGTGRLARELEKIGFK
ncbi:MAG: site-specific integrase [Bernardetiaceae bacterium]|jgi:site-specific recombinase XerD|nr:site-specific integrase [Bernardetiaceae bacterium]